MRMAENLTVILGVEAMCAAQGIEFRAPLPTSAPLQRVVAALRTVVPALEDDRFLAPDLEGRRRPRRRAARSPAQATGTALPDPLISSVLKISSGGPGGEAPPGFPPSAKEPDP
jgi:histidine ammonia-lyase